MGSGSDEVRYGEKRHADQEDDDPDEPPPDVGIPLALKLMEEVGLELTSSGLDVAPPSLRMFGERALGRLCALLVLAILLEKKRDLFFERRVGIHRDEAGSVSADCDSARTGRLDHHVLTPAEELHQASPLVCDPLTKRSPRAAETRDKLRGGHEQDADELAAGSEARKQLLQQGSLTRLLALPLTREAPGRRFESCRAHSA